MAVPLVQIVQLTLTNRCQCNCEHCGVSNLREAVTGELSLEQLDRIFRDLKLAGCEVVDLFGGEPTLRRDLFDIIARGKAWGFIVSLETNGFVVDQAFVDRLVAAQLDQVYLSLDDYRAEFHDRRRRTPGCFERAVRALRCLAKAPMAVHVSIVPQTTEFFTEGHINRFMQFVLEQGAQQVRLLLPRYVGRSYHGDEGPFCAGRERELFAHVAPQYRDFIYVHTPGTPLVEQNLCTAKQMFCHIMSNGWVAPCPYFPLVFGDATREPVMDVFERIQSHPLVRLGGAFCPMRNPDYITQHLSKLGMDRPFFPIEVGNQVNLGAPCEAGCAGCSHATQSEPRPAADILRDLARVDANYSRVEFFGGDALARGDLFEILERVPTAMEATLWSACRRLPQEDVLAERLARCRVGAVKVMLPPQLMDAATWGEAAWREVVETLRRARSLGLRGVPVQLYLPANAAPALHQLVQNNLPQLCLERVYLFQRDANRPLVNAAACFGKTLGSVRLVWRRADAPVRMMQPLAVSEC